MHSYAAKISHVVDKCVCKRTVITAVDTFVQMAGPPDIFKWF